MGYAAIDQGLARQVGERLEVLAKSFAAGYQGMSNAGRQGISALTQDNVDSVLRSITMQESQFLISKDIPTLKATQSVYMYNVKTAVASGLDLSGFEGFLPQEDTSQYLRVAEVLKVYGIRKSITQMAQFTNEAGGFSIDIEKENDVNAALAMAQVLERDLYIGGDLYMDSNGAIDGAIAANVNGPIRNIRGIQANVREGDAGLRGIPGDFIGYGNSRSVVFDRQGGVVDRNFLDRVVTSVRDNLGAVAEGHCTTAMLTEFRAQFFPFERGSLSEAYAIRGAGITNEELMSVPIQTVGGVINFIPTVFKYMRQRPVPVLGSVGIPPSTPAITGVATAAFGSSGFAVNDVYSYRVQAVNISGMSQGSAASLFTVVIANRANTVTITAPGTFNVEYYNVFRSPIESSGAAGTEMFIGKVIASRTGATTFIDNNRVIPGLDAVLLMPKDKKRAKLAVLGNLLNKIELGIRGTAMEYCFASYVGCVVDTPRSFAIIDNCYQKREGI